MVGHTPLEKLKYNTLSPPSPTYKTKKKKMIIKVPPPKKKNTHTHTQKIVRCMDDMMYMQFNQPTPFQLLPRSTKVLEPSLHI